MYLSMNSKFCSCAYGFDETAQVCVKLNVYVGIVKVIIS